MLLICKNYSRENQATFYINTEPERKMQHLSSNSNESACFGTSVDEYEESEMRRIPGACLLALLSGQRVKNTVQVGTFEERS